MNNIKTFGRFICESNTQDCFELFGEELFGEEMGGTEKNTEIQKEYAKSIREYTGEDFGDNITPKMIEAVKNLRHCMSKYPEVLINNGTKIYRGLKIKIDDDNSHPVMKKIMDVEITENDVLYDDRMNTYVYIENDVDYSQKI